MNIDKITPYFEPMKEILPYLGKYPNEPEMSEFESVFLCGLIKENRPKKILEVGVAAGGTTAIMLQCLFDIGDDTEMCSVDICEDFYIDPAKKTGFLATEAIERLRYKNHKFYTGGGV